MNPIPPQAPPNTAAAAFESSFLSQVTARRETLCNANQTLLAGFTSYVLEIGCGHGHMLSAYAATHPGKLCIGIDIIADRIDRANRKKNRAHLSNLYFLHASAEDFLASMPSHISLSDIFVLFPDPWPKRRHHKNRLMQPEFLTQLGSKVTEASRLYFRTDDLAYFTATEAVFQTHPGWMISGDPWVFEFATVFQERASGHYSLVGAPKKPGAAQPNPVY
jgi:tRNA (guanine-N7-)-methyltransferase